MGLAVPIVNGRRYDFTSVEISINGVPLVGRAISSINDSDTLEPGVVRGGSALPLGLTRGEYSAEMSLEMPKEESRMFLAALAATSLGTGSALGYMESRFEVSVAYAEGFGQTQTDRLNGCRVKRVDESHARGSDGLTVRFECFVQYVNRDGLSPLGVDAMIK
jgi:hypothetical protein